MLRIMRTHLVVLYFNVSVFLNLNRTFLVHSGQTTGHARDLSTFGHFPVSSQNFHGQPPPLEPSRY